jgi:hypothetical protein
VNYLNKPKGIGEMTSEPGIEIKGYPLFKTGAPNSLLVFDETYPDKAPDVKPLLRPGENFWVMYPRGIDDSEWTRKSPPNYVERSHALLGRTVDQGRLWDVIATLRYLKKEGKPAVRVIGQGRAGVIAAYAALFEPSVEEVVLLDPPASHKDGPFFLGVLRVLDVPDALGLLAPRKLTLVNAKDKAFDRTAEIYKLAGVADKLQRK